MQIGGTRTGTRRATIDQPNELCIDCSGLLFKQFLRPVRSERDDIKQVLLTLRNSYRCGAY